MRIHFDQGRSRVAGYRGRNPGFFLFSFSFSLAGLYFYMTLDFLLCLKFSGVFAPRNMGGGGEALLLPLNTPLRVAANFFFFSGLFFCDFRWFEHSF